MRIIWLDETGAPAQPESSQIRTLASLGDAFDVLRQLQPQIFVVALPLATSTSTKVLEWAKHYSPATAVMFYRQLGGADEALALVKEGAAHYFDHSPSLDEIRRREQTPAFTLQEPTASELSDHTDWRKRMVGASHAMDQVSDTIDLIADRRSTVLILGETGTGKEVVARSIHQASRRGSLPLVTVNCAAIPENLIEAELFGHVKGAFTGASGARTGRFEQAHRSTLFLDEIGDLPLDLQAKLLRALQEREFQRVGSSETIKVDVRVIAATNVNLLDRVRQGRLREDLYYRLNVVPMRIPPLRDRREDIPLLVEHFINQVCSQERMAIKQVSPAALEELGRYPWPGNVRQLENSIEMAVVLSGDRKLLTPADFALSPSAGSSQVKLNGDRLLPLPEEGLDFEAVIGRIELNLLQQALERAQGNKKAAADMLGLKRTTLAAKLRSLEVYATRS
jgi:DNA-binding NtrC family response regulator